MSPVPGRAFFALLTAIISCICHLSSAQETRELWVPSDQLKTILKQKPRAVFLTPEQYQTLTTDAHRAKLVEEKEKITPPVQATVRSVSMTGKIEPGADVVSITANYRIECLTDKWTEVPIILPRSHLGRIELDKESAVRSTDAANSMLLTRGKGAHEVSATFHLPVSRTPGGDIITVHSPGIAVASLVLDIPQGTKLKSDLPFRIDNDKANFTIPSQAGGSWPIEWTAREVASIPGAALFQTCSYLYTFDSTRLQADLGIILNSSLIKLADKYTVSLTDGARVLSVEGSELHSWNRLPDKSIEIKLQPGVRDTTDLRLRVEQNVPEPGETNEMTVALPIANISDVHRASGTMTVLGSDDIRIKQIATGPLTVPIPDDVEGPTTNLPNYVASFQFPVQQQAPTVSLSKIQNRFNTQLDTAINLTREAIYIERTLALLPIEGNLFETDVALPESEQVAQVTCNERKDFSWQESEPQLKLRWDSGLSAAEPATVKILTRLDPENWYQLGTTPVDLKFQSIGVSGAESLSGYVAVAFDSSFQVATGATEGLAPRDGRNTPVKGNLAWFRLDDFSLELKPARKPPELEAAFTAYALPLANTLEIEGQISLQILNSGIRQLTIDTDPATAQYLRFDSPVLAQQELDETTGVWTLTFHEEQSGTAQVRYSMNLPLDVTETAETEGEKKFEITMPKMLIKSAKRTRGDWIMEANTDTELTFSPEGLDEVDSLHVPAVSGYRPRHRIIAAFEYRGDDWKLDLSGVRHPHSDHVVTVVDLLELDTVVSTDGTDRHQATLMVRSTGDQFLEIKLPKNSVLWSLSVDREIAKPVRSGRDRLRVQLPAHEDSRKNIEIVVIYQTPGATWRGSGSEKLLPVTVADEIPVMQSSWRLHLPEGFDYQRFNTSMKRQFQSTDRILLGYWAEKLNRRRSSRRPMPPQIVADVASVAAPGEVELQPVSPQIAKSYVIRIQEAVKRADDAALRGSLLMADGDFEGAVEQYRNSMDLLPDAPMTAQRYRAYAKQYSRAATTLARQYADGGRYNEAMGLLEGILRPSVSPENVAAKRLLEQLNDPEYYSPAVTPQHLERVRKIKMALKTGQGYLDYGDYDRAEREYHKALNIDRYNSAARRSLEEVSRHRLNYYETARDQTRANFLRQIASEWEMPNAINISDSAHSSETADIIRNESKLKSIVIPSLEFQDTPLRDALQFIQQRAVELDQSEPDPARKGCNIILSASDFSPPSSAPGDGFGFEGGDGGGLGAQGGVGDTPITLRLTNVPLGEALRYTTNLAQMKYKVESHAVVVVPLSTPDADLFTNQYTVPPTFLSGGGGGGAGNVDPFAPDSAVNGVPARRISAKEILENAGITFPPGAAVIYNPGTSRLIVKNTPDQMDLVEAYIESIRAADPATPGSIFRLPSEEGGDTAREAAIAEIEEKLNNIRIPSLELSNTPLKDAIAFLQQKAVELDVADDTSIEAKGVNLILPESLTPADGGGFGFEGGQSGGGVGNTPINLRLTNVPLGEALRYVTNLAQLKYQINPDGVVVVPLSTPASELSTNRYVMPPDLYRQLTSSASGGGGAAAAADPFAAEPASTSSGPITPKQAMENAGITFPSGATVNFDPATGVLTVTNSNDQNDLVEAYLSSLDYGKPIVQLTSKHVESDYETSPSFIDSMAMAGTTLNSIDELPKLEDKFNSAQITITENRLSLETTVIEGVDFRNKTVEEAVDILEAKIGTVPEGGHATAPLEIELEVDKSDTEDPAKKKLDFSIAKATALEVLDKIVGESDTRYYVTKSGVVIADKNTEIQPMETVFIPMPPRVFQSVEDDGSIREHHARTVLKAAGINFPRGSSAAYNPATGRLAVRNTKENLKAVVNQYSADMKAVAENPDAPQNDLRFSSHFLGGAMDLKGFNVRDIGRLPIAFDLPQSGRMFQFRCLHAPDAIGFRYVNWERQIRAAWGWILVGAIGFLIGAWRVAKMPLFLGLFVIVLLSFLPMATTQGLAPVCNSILIGWLLGIAAFIVYWVVRKVSGVTDWKFLVVPFALVLICSSAEAGEGTNFIQANAELDLSDKSDPTDLTDIGLGFALLLACLFAARKIRFLSLSLIAVFLVPAAYAESQTVYVPYDPEKPVSEQKATRYYLDYETFDRLWKRVKQHRRKTTQTEDDIKSDYSITTALYRMNSTPEMLSVTGRISVTTRGDDWQRVPFSFAGANLSEIKLNGKAASFQNGAVLIEKAGSHLVEVTFEIPFEDSRDTAEWSIPESPATLLEITMDSDVAEPVLLNDWPMAKSGERLFTAAIGKQNKISFRRRLKTSGRSMTRPNSVIIDARLFVAQGLEQLEASYRLNFPGQEDNRFSIAFENTLTPVSFDIPNLSLWEIKDKAGTNLRELTFQMTQPVRDSLEVKFTGERMTVDETRTFPQLSAEASRVEQVRSFLRAAGLAIKARPETNHRQIASPANSSGFFPVSTWSLTGRNRDLNYVVTEKRAKRSAKASYVYQLGSGKLETIAQFQIRSPEEPLLSSKFTVPANAKVQRIDGNRIKDWWRTGDELFIRFSGGTPEVTAVLIYLTSAVADSEDQFSLSVSALPIEGFEPDEVSGEALVVAHTTRDISISFSESRSVVREIDPAVVAKDFEILPPMARKRGFRFERMNFTGEIASSELTPRFNSLWVMLAQVHETWVRLSVHTDLEVIRSGLDRVTLQTALEVPEFRIPGDDIREVRITEADGLRNYEVIFQQYVTDGISFTIETELPHSGTVALPDVSILNGDRQERFLIVENLSPERMDMEPENLDTTVMALLPYKPTTLASAKLFRASRPDWSLDIELENLETSAGNDAVILYAELTSAFRANGEEWLKAEYRLQNRSLQFLPVAMPAESELVSVVVAGSEVRADKGKIDGTEVILIPLIQTKPGQLSYDVKLVFRKRGEPATGKKVKRSFDDPEVFGPTVEKTIWKVHLPEGHTLAGHKGNMQPIGEQESRLRKLQSDMSELKSLNWLSTQVGEGARVRSVSNKNAEKLAQRIKSTLDGFVTYGEPIDVQSMKKDLKAQQIVITENRIEMPEPDAQSGNITVDAGGDISWADNSGEIKRRNLNYYDVARDQTRRLETQMRVNDNIAIGNNYFNSWQEEPKQESKAVSGKERYSQIGHLNTTSNPNAVKEKMLALNRVQNVEQAEVIGKKTKASKPAKKSSPHITYSNARSNFAQIGHGGAGNVTVETEPDPFGGGSGAANMNADPFGGSAAQQPQSGRVYPVQSGSVQGTVSQEDEGFTEAFKAIGRRSISVDFPVEGPAFFFQKLKDHAELVIISKQNRDSDRMAAIFGMLALLGLIVLFKLIFQIFKRQSR